VFERDLEQALAGAVAVGPDVRLVVTEGNYLLLDRPGWRDLTSVLTETWFVEVDDVERVRRLVARHELFGKSHDAAVAWVATVDEPNAALVRSTRDRADVVVTG
jgi:pantothenate kinase